MVVADVLVAWVFHAPGPLAPTPPKTTAKEFKAGKRRKADKDAELQGRQRVRRESASRLWTEVTEAFEEKAGRYFAIVGEEILPAPRQPSGARAHPGSRYAAIRARGGRWRCGQLGLAATVLREFQRHARPPQRAGARPCFPFPLRIW